MILLSLGIQNAETFLSDSESTKDRASFVVQKVKEWAREHTEDKQMSAHMQTIIDQRHLSDLFTSILVSSGLEENSSAKKENQVIKSKIRLNLRSLQNINHLLERLSNDVSRI